MAGRNIAPSKRGNITGWSAAAVRRHTAWLYSIDVEQLDGNGFALSLTTRLTPVTADDFHAVRRAWYTRVMRMGATRIHWVIEWQRRGTPHLHAAVYFPTDATPDAAGQIMAAHWVTVADAYEPAFSGQHVDVIDGPMGWLRYLSKHASRGVKHYQRNGHPEGWERTGRLWGHGDGWPSETPMRFDMSREAYWRYRRLVRSWRIADARKSLDPDRIAYARRMLACPLPKLSAVRGVSDWIPESITVAFVGLLVEDGYTVAQRVDA